MICCLVLRQATADRRRRASPSPATAAAGLARGVGGGGSGGVFSGGGGGNDRQGEQCPQCGASFGDIGSLVAHVEAFHSEVNYLYKGLTLKVVVVDWPAMFLPLTESSAARVW